LFSAQVGHAVVGPAQLEAEHRLLVFALQQDVVAQAPRQVLRRLERCFNRHVIHLGRQDLLQVVRQRQPGTEFAGGWERTGTLTHGGGLRLGALRVAADHTARCKPRRNRAAQEKQPKTLLTWAESTNGGGGGDNRPGLVPSRIKSPMSEV
jgi:hypothetical protein